MQKGCADRKFWYNLYCCNGFRQPETSEAPGNDFPEKKIASISKEYFSVPSDKLFYYLAAPDTPKNLAEEKANEDDETATVAADQQE